MSGKLKAASRRGLIIKIALATVVLGAAGVLLLRGVNIRLLIDETLAWIRTIGPVPFFLGLAVLPAVGFPLLAFTLTAGPVFAPQLGMTTVAVCMIASLTVNVALTYWLARYAFRPLLESLVQKMGYRLPQVGAEDHLSLAIVVRVTPGPPFFVQGYLLGLAGVPFKIYMVVSVLFAGSFSLAVLFFGDSLVNGRGKTAFLAFSAFVGLTVLVSWIRKKYSRKKMVDVV